MMRLAKRNTTFMSCSMNSTVISRDRSAMTAKQLGALVLRHAGRRLVEQQHPRPGRERQRDLEQPLLAIGELARRPVAGSPSRSDTRMRVGLVDGIAHRRGSSPPPVAGVAAPLADRERHRLERGEVREQRVDLERAHEPALARAPAAAAR